MNIDDELVDISSWNKVLSNIKDRKIIIFGAGNNGNILLELLPYEVSYFIDNDRDKWNTEFKNILIKNPEVLKEEKEDISVLVVGYLYEDMINQLSKYNLGNNVHIYNIYSILENFLNKTSFISRGKELIKFFQGIKDLKDIDKYCNKETVSILISNFCFSSSPFYLMTISVMLRLRGNKVKIIWDDLEGLDDLYYKKDNITYVQNMVIKEVLDYITEKFAIEVIKISEITSEDLDEDDIKEIKKLAKVNTISKYRKVFTDEEFSEYEVKCFEILKDNLKKVKGLFKKNKFDKIITFTGLHKKTGLYSWVGSLNKTQVFSYDSSSLGLLITTDGVVTHYGHIEKMLIENMLSDKLSEELISFTEENFRKRLEISNDINSYVYQKVNYNRNINCYDYDIIIPLNICWDGAALGYDGIFNSIGEWLIETIKYVLENTDAKIAVRQHPAERFFNSGKDIRERLEANFRKNPRYKYISSEEEINTYNLIKDAKVVLPHTSTIGIESALLNKKVIMATYSYYSGMNFVYKASSREQYFSLISNALNETKKDLSDKKMKQAKLTYALLMNTAIKTKFTDVNMNFWINEMFDELLKNEVIKSILSIFESGNPIDIYKTKRFNI